MPPHGKCRVAAIVSSDSEDQGAEPPTNSTTGAGKSSAKRPRKITPKAAAASEEEKAKKQQAEYRRLKAQVKVLRKQLDQQKASADNDDLQDPDASESDPDRLPPESEEENVVELGLAASIQRISTVTSKPTTQAREKPHIHRRKGTAPPPSEQPPHPSESGLASKDTPGGGNATGSSSSSIQPAMASTTEGWHATASDMPPTPLPTPALSRSTSAPATSHENTVPVSSHASAPLTDGTPGLQRAPFRGGTAPPSGARPKVEDYADDVKELLLDAIKHFSCYIYTKNAFPSDTQQDTFTTDAWKAACDARDEPILYELSDQMKRIIWARKSNARGDVSDEVRPHTAGAYGFRDGATTSNKCHNAALYAKLVQDGAFHHKSVNDVTGKPEGFAGHPYISRVIRMAFFGSTCTAIGFRFPEAFNPIPTETVAFVLTVIRAHIEEWSTGHHLAVKFSESEFSSTYKGLCEDLKAWVEGNEDVWLNIRKRWYQRAFVDGGGVMVESGNGRVSKAVLDSAREELEGRTGLTDSEDEAAPGGHEDN